MSWTLEPSELATQGPWSGHSHLSHLTSRERPSVGRLEPTFLLDTIGSGSSGQPKPAKWRPPQRCCLAAQQVLWRFPQPPHHQAFPCATYSLPSHHHFLLPLRHSTLRRKTTTPSDSFVPSLLPTPLSLVAGTSQLHRVSSSELPHKIKSPLRRVPHLSTLVTTPPSTFLRTTCTTVSRSSYNRGYSCFRHIVFYINTKGSSSRNSSWLP